MLTDCGGHVREVGSIRASGGDLLDAHKRMIDDAECAVKLLIPFRDLDVSRPGKQEIRQTIKQADKQLGSQKASSMREEDDKIRNSFS